MSCIFCDIVAGQSKATILYRDELVTAFKDIRPISNLHYLIVTNRHIESVNDLETGDEALIGHMVMVAKKLSQQEGVAEKGYRLLVNTGSDGGQTVFHLHLHLIAGKLARFHLG